MPRSSSHSMMSRTTTSGRGSNDVSLSSSSLQIEAKPRAMTYPSLESTWRSTSSGSSGVVPPEQKPRSILKKSDRPSKRSMRKIAKSKQLRADWLSTSLDEIGTLAGVGMELYFRFLLLIPRCIIIEFSEQNTPLLFLDNSRNERRLRVLFVLAALRAFHP